MRPRKATMQFDSRSRRIDFSDRLLAADECEIRAKDLLR